MKLTGIRKPALIILTAALLTTPLHAFGSGLESSKSNIVGSQIVVKEWVSDSGLLDAGDLEDSLRIRNAPEYDTQEAASYAEIMPEIREMTEGLNDDRNLVLFGPCTPSEEALNKLLAEIDHLSMDHHTVSLIMVDLKNRSGLAYNSSAAMCSQSTIKGIYLGALLEERPELLAEHRQDFHDAIVYSDNDAYEGLRELYGNEPLLRWCDEAGVDAGFAELLYPRANSAKDMFKMWTVLYRYLNGNTCDPEFASWFADSRASAAALMFRDRYPVQTKAGWETGYYVDELDPEGLIDDRYVDGDPLNDEIAANDSGVVYTEDGPYLFVIYTDHFFDYYENVVLEHPLCGLEEALCEAKLSMQES